jgi:uncharacterized membrane protein
MYVIIEFFYLVEIINLALNIIFQIFSYRKEKKMELILHTKLDDKEENG